MKEDKVQADIIKEAESFVRKRVKPYINDFEERGIPKSLIKEMAAKGYLAAAFPKKYGGLELDPLYFGLFTKIFGGVCPALRSLITVHTSIVGKTLLRFGTEVQKDKWIPDLAAGERIAAFALSEPEIGSDAKNIKTTWQEKEGCYVINGIKKWITYGHLADVFIIIASNNGKSTAFLVEKSFSGLETNLIKGLMAGRGTYLAEVHLNNVKVPRENVIGKLNYGFEYVVSKALDFGRYSIAWAGLGIAEEALNSMVSYSRRRSQFGNKLRSFQLIRGMIGDAVTRVHAARAVCIKAGKLRREKSPEAVIETTIAKYFASKVAVQVTNDALQVHGGNGFTNEYMVEKLYREAKVLEIIEGSSQMQQEIISKYGLQQYYKRGEKK